MQPIRITEPAWYTTFPHLVAPREGEGLTGLLLRCDEANLWGTGMTLTYLLGSTSRPEMRERVTKCKVGSSPFPSDLSHSP